MQSTTERQLTLSNETDAYDIHWLITTYAQKVWNEDAQTNIMKISSQITRGGNKIVLNIIVHIISFRKRNSEWMDLCGCATMYIDR